jgi:hypothetical protein
MAHDPVERPKHYTSHPSGVECIQVTEHLNFCLGNAVKYIWRAGEKGDAVEDLRKARWYLDREIARLLAEREQDGRRSDAGCVAAVREPGPASAVAAGPSPQGAAPCAPAPAAVVPVRGRRKAGPAPTYRTPERSAVLKRDYPAGRQNHEIRAEMARLPGDPLPPSGQAISTWAFQLGLRRPAGFRRGAAISAGQLAANADRRSAAAATWDEALAWAETVDPDLVLKGSREERLAQINELRRLEGQKPFVLAEAA